MIESSTSSEVPSLVDRGTRWAASTSVVVLLLSGCSLRSDEPDHLLLPRADPDVSLASAVDRFGLPRPRRAAVQSWGQFTSMTDVGLYLWLDAPCPQIDDYLDRAGAGEAKSSKQLPEYFRYNDTISGWPLSAGAVGLEQHKGGRGLWFAYQARAGRCDAFIVGMFD